MPLQNLLNTAAAELSLLAPISLLQRLRSEHGANDSLTSSLAEPLSGRISSHHIKILLDMHLGRYPCCCSLFQSADLCIMIEHYERFLCKLQDMFLSEETSASVRARISASILQRYSLSSAHAYDRPSCILTELVFRTGITAL